MRAEPAKDGSPRARRKREVCGEWATRTKGATRNSYSGPRLSLARAAALSAPSTELVAATRKSLDWRARTRSSVPTRNKHGEGFPHMLSPARVNNGPVRKRDRTETLGPLWSFTTPSGSTWPSAGSTREGKECRALCDISRSSTGGSSEPRGAKTAERR